MPVTCPRCETVHTKAVPYCENCGFDLSDVSVGLSEAPTSSKKQSNQTPVAEVVSSRTQIENIDAN